MLVTRTNHVLGPLGALVRDPLWRHAQAAALHWRENLRYHANKPYDYELSQVADAADWLEAHYRALWS